jgi:peptide/nickel transport system permease protein
MAVTQQTYIEAARSFGARGARRMILPHVVPNIVQPIVAQVAVLAGFALIAEASLSFVQLGVQPPTASWGAILARSYTFMELAPLSIFVPGLAIAVTVFSLNIVGEEVQRMIDPRRR